MTNIIYPICNRGNQFATMCVASLAFVKLFDLDKYKPQTIDDILKYGDRMHTIVMKSRTDDLKKLDLGLSEAEKCLILNQTKITTVDLMKNFVIGDWKVEMEVEAKAIEGDINARDDDENILNITKAIDSFLDDHEFGIFYCKGVAQAFCKVDEFYYLFDPASRGPSGYAEENGTACMTRHVALDTMVPLIYKNLPKENSNEFYIDSITFTYERYERPAPPMEEIITIKPKITGFNEIDPGKLILSGNFNMNNPKFGKATNAACCANALVAQGMSLIHKPEMWTKPIIDEVVTQANILYEISKEDMPNFNQFEDKMDILKVKKKFKIGCNQVVCDVDEDNTQKGVLCIKHPNIYNLRRGLEAFFETRDRGVIFSECQTCAIWKECELIYMFDPYPRSSTGLYLNGGNACLVICKTLKILNDHFIANIPEKRKDSDFIIYPVGVQVSEIKDKRKKPMLKCQILRCKEIPSFISSCKDNKEEKPPEKKVPFRGVLESPYMRPPRESDQYFTTPQSSIEAKKEWARAESLMRSRKELEKLLKQLRREYYQYPNGMAILRAHYSQNNKKFSKSSRNHQQIPNCLVAIVMSKLHPPNTWTYKNIEIILDSGDTLYKDSWWFYKPLNPDLGLKNVLRTFYIQCCKFTTNIFKPAILGDMVFRALYVGLLNFFLHETSGIVVSTRITVAVFQKAGYYYIFDPYDRDKEGQPVPCGCACVMRFTNVEDLTRKLLINGEYWSEEGEPGKYSIHAVCLAHEKKLTSLVSTVTSSVRTCQTEDIV